MADNRIDESSAKLTTFGGVFTPSLLTILGLVLFLRVGYVAGNVGLTRMLVIIGLATSVSVLTTISLAAIATNLRVGGGGVYFLISRTLGPAFGGAIGLVLYAAMSVSVAFYAIGLGEAVTSMVGSGNENLPRLVAAVTIVALLGLAWLGADIATRLQYVVMVCLAVAIVGFMAGVLPDLSVDRLGDNLGRPLDGDGFWVAFAIFFPAITGFTQGVAMSGDLENAQPQHHRRHVRSHRTVDDRLPGRGGHADDGGSARRATRGHGDHAPTRRSPRAHRHRRDRSHAVVGDRVDSRCTPHAATTGG